MKKAGKALNKDFLYKTFFTFVTFITFFTLHAYSASFSNSARGTTTAQFLKLGPGARAIAMGEAHTALVADSQAIYWNPAALSRSPKHSMSMMHAPYLESMYFDWVSYSINTRNLGAFGIGAQYFNAGKIDRRDNAGVKIGNFTPTDYSVSFAYAKETSAIGEMFMSEMFGGYSLGIAFKLVRSEIVASDSAMTFDLGMLAPLVLDKFRFGLAMQNIGGKLTFDEKPSSLPFVFRAGVATKTDGWWTLAMDAVFQKDNRPGVALGAERKFYPSVMNPDLMFNLRGGMNSRFFGQNIGGIGGGSLGFGILWKAMSFDYAISPMGNLGLTHRTSMSFAF
ncbi:PorV/PorQ family protein [Elusimicrobiota bacterium]